MALRVGPRYAAVMRIAATDLNAISHHLQAKGWAMAADVLDDDAVSDLREAVREHCAPVETGGTNLDGAVIEHAPAVLALVSNPRFMAVMRACVGVDDLVVHRSAAILRMPGSPQVGWHSDFDFSTLPPVTPNERLNRGEWPNGAWFYLNGSHPDRGGLAVVEGSHLPTWRPPADWDRQTGWDLPGVVEIHSEPGDLVLFSARTWHAARPHNANVPRLSVGVALRPAQVQVAGVGLPPPATQAFLADLPATVAPLFKHYAGWIAA